MRPLRHSGPSPARIGGVALWVLAAEPAGDSVARAAGLLGRDVTRDERGRPGLARGDVSIAHAGGLWVLAATDRADGRLGVDIEPLRERANALELARAHFPAPEADYLASLAPQRRSRAFLRLWCAREAVLKALGAGLAGGFDSVRFAIDAKRITTPGWRVIEFMPARGYLGALVVPAKAGTQ